MAASLTGTHSDALGRVLRGEGVLRACDRVAERGADIARSIAPVRTGRYKASFRVVRFEYRGRHGARVLNDVRSPAGAPYGVFLEFGTRYMRRQRILGRTAEALKAQRH